MDTKSRVQALQSLMQRQGIDAYVVPSADAHQSEYVADAWRRREYISGFTGSAGLFACTVHQAGIWTDSRYWIQAEAELAGTGIDLHRSGDLKVLDWKDWVLQELKPGAKLGLNPQLFSIDTYRTIEAKLQGTGISLVASEDDLVDQVWASTRPRYPFASLREHPLAAAGEERLSKLTRLRQCLRDEGAGAVVISALDEIAWLLNLRGADVEFNPVFYAYVVVTANQATLYVGLDKIPDALGKILSPHVMFKPYDALMSDLSALAKSAPVWLDPATTSAAVHQKLQVAQVPLLLKTTPIPAWKAKKNAAELHGMRQAHLRDGVALVRFIAWFKDAIKNTALTELSVADKLESFRRLAPEFIGPSFATIAGYGPNGALPHYRATPQSFLPLRREGILLLDSGGQYLDGTTDITRTFACGTPTNEEKHIYTQVLKGHLQLARSLFPVGTNGYQLDALARQPLWRSMLDYGHGTGHGVGAALCVHEGPFSISTRKNTPALEVGAIASNEPACYLPGRFGVRIENLVTVTEHAKTAWGQFLRLDDLTLCPYERELIATELLQPEEIAQVNTYHGEVRARLINLVDGQARVYLEQATRPLD